MLEQDCNFKDKAFGEYIIDFKEYMDSIKLSMEKRDFNIFIKAIIKFKSLWGIDSDFKLSSSDSRNIQLIKNSKWETQHNFLVLHTSTIINDKYLDYIKTSKFKNNWEILMQKYGYPERYYINENDKKSIAWLDELMNLKDDRNDK